jgi:DNA/RNA endonuclease YhcR with UshA esterase domain
MRRKKAWRDILFVIVTLLVAVSIAYAQGRRGQMRGMPRYNTATEVTLSGTITNVETHMGRMGWNGTHLVVSFGAETLDVHVGPSNYLAQQGFSFAPGEQIQVTGSRIKFEGSDALIAREIKKGEQVLKLRNSQGIPAWSRSRWRY